MSLSISSQFDILTHFFVKNNNQQKKLVPNDPGHSAKLQVYFLALKKLRQMKTQNVSKFEMFDVISINNRKRHTNEIYKVVPTSNSCIILFDYKKNPTNYLSHARNSFEVFLKKIDTRCSRISSEYQVSA